MQPWAFGCTLHSQGPYYTIPVGSSAMREMRERMQGEGVSVYDIEFVIIDPDFAAAADGDTQIRR